MNATDPSFCASINPAIVDPIEINPPSHAHQFTLEICDCDGELPCRASKTTSIPANPVAYTTNPATTGCPSCLFN